MQLYPSRWYSYLCRVKEMFLGVRAGGFEGSKEGEQGEQDLLSYRLVAFPFLLSWLSLFLLPKKKGNSIYPVFVFLVNVSPFTLSLSFQMCSLILACSSSLLHSLVFLQHNLIQHKHKASHINQWCVA